MEWINVINDAIEFMEKNLTEEIGLLEVTRRLLKMLRRSILPAFSRRSLGGHTRRLRLLLLLHALTRAEKGII